MSHITKQISWIEFHKSCQTLCVKLAEHGSWDWILAITRGGLIPAGIIAQELSIHTVETIGIQSYTPENTQESLQLLKDFTIQRGACLIVDDLIDSGNTAQYVKSKLPHATIATVYVKPMGINFANFYEQVIPQETWVVFPWE